MAETSSVAERVRAAVDDAEGVLSVMWELFPQLRVDLRTVLDEREQIRATFQSLFDNALAKVADAAWHLDMAWPGWRDFAAAHHSTSNGAP
jgi:hypothetical protein